MGRNRGPARQGLVKKIIWELEMHPEGVWVRKLARILNEPLMTVHKYVRKKCDGYPGEQIEVIKRMPQERGGNLLIRLALFSNTGVHEIN